MTTYELAKTNCWKCGGRKYIDVYRHVHGGVCFACAGVGFRYDSPKAADAFAAMLPRKVTSELVVGDRVRETGITHGGDTYTYWATVKEIDGFNVTTTSRYGDVRHIADSDGTAWKMSYTRAIVQGILAELAPRFKGGILVDGVKRSKPRKTDEEKAATRAAAAAKREAERHVANPASDKQIALIMSLGFEPFRPVSKVEASQVIDRIFRS